MPPPDRRGPEPVVRGARTAGDDSWRADALGSSRHTRWADELRAPLEDHDPEKATEICAAVTRRALRDLAPAVILFGTEERLRLQALAAFTVTLFDFANQTGLEGERLAQINRIEFDLERALDNEPPGQPVFVSMARTHAALPWPREALDTLVSVARSRVGQPRPSSIVDVEDDARRLGAALAGAWLGEPAGDTWTELLSGLVRLTELAGLAESARRHRLRLAVSEVPDDWLAASGQESRIEAAVAAESRCIRGLLNVPHGPHVPHVPIPSPASKGTRRAARYARKSGLELLDRIDALGGEVVRVRPSLSAFTRLRLLAASWF